MFCSKRFVEFWWLNMQNWFCHHKLSLSLPLYISISSISWSERRQKNRAITQQKGFFFFFKWRKNTGYKMSLALTASLLRSLSFLLTNWFLFCVSSKYIVFVYVNVCAQLVFVWNQLTQRFHKPSNTKIFQLTLIVEIVAQRQKKEFVNATQINRFSRKRENKKKNCSIGSR